MLKGWRVELCWQDGELTVELECQIDTRKVARRTSNICCIVYTISLVLCIWFAWSISTSKQTVKVQHRDGQASPGQHSVQTKLFTTAWARLAGIATAFGAPVLTCFRLQDNNYRRPTLDPFCSSFKVETSTLPPQRSNNAQKPPCSLTNLGPKSPFHCLYRISH